MSYVQVAVPKELYDKLGLRLNQTITLKCSDDTCELDTHVGNSDTLGEASNEHHKIILSKKTNSNDDTAALNPNDSATQKHDGTFQVIHVNPCDNQTLSSPNVSLPTPSLNLQSHTSEQKDDSDSSNDCPASDIDAVNCDMPTPKKAKMNVGTASQGSIFNPRVVQFIRYPRPEIPNYPRNCEKCSHKFFNHNTFRRHKGYCGKPYEMCPACHRSYSNPYSYRKHKDKCEEYQRNQYFDKHKSIVKAVSSSNTCDLNTSGNDAAGCSNSDGVEGSAEGEKTEKWIPVTDLRNVHKYFIVKNK